MSDKPLISEDELTRFVLRQVYLSSDARESMSSWAGESTIASARVLARKMLAAEKMYAAMKESLNCRYLRDCEGCTNEFKSALKLAEGSE